MPSGGRTGATFVPRAPVSAVTTRPRALAALLALAAVPWSVQTYAAGGATLLFPWGLVNASPPTVTTLPAYLFVYTAGLPEFILAWPLSVGLYALALASAVVGLAAGREDPRLTGGLLVAAGIAQLTVASGFSVQPGRAAYPLGTAALWAVAWRVYWSAVRAGRGRPGNRRGTGAEGSESGEVAGADGSESGSGDGVRE